MSEDKQRWVVTRRWYAVRADTAEAAIEATFPDTADYIEAEPLDDGLAERVQAFLADRDEKRK